MYVTCARGEKMLGKYIRVRIDHPIGTADEKTGYTYPLNYGAVYGYENLNSFVMGIDHPVRNFDGRVIATLNPKAGGRQILITAPKSTRFIINDIAKYIDAKKIFPRINLNAFTKAAAALLFTEI